MNNSHELYIDICCVDKYHSKLLETRTLNTREEAGCQGFTGDLSFRRIVDVYEKTNRRYLI